MLTGLQGCRIVDACYRPAGVKRPRHDDRAISGVSERSDDLITLRVQSLPADHIIEWVESWISISSNRD